MYYITINFHSGRILAESWHKFEGIDNEHLIPYTVLGNALRIMCGEIPIPSKRETILSKIRNPIYEEIAKKSFVKYDMDVKFQNDNPNVYEFMQGSKYQLNSHRKLKSSIKSFNGEEIKGYYTWNYLYRGLMNKEHFYKIVHLLNEALNYKNGNTVTNKNFYEICEELKTLENYDEYRDKMNNLFTEINNYKKQPKLSSWQSLLYGCNGKGTPNGFYSNRMPLLNMNSIIYSVVFSGTIICPIDETDNEIVKNKILYKLKENSGLSSFSNGGVMEIVGFGKETKDPNFMDSFGRIFNEN